MDCKMDSFFHHLKLLFLFSSILCLCSAKNLPCAQYEGDGGLVCVCNSTYCDTITAPTKLKTGKYYHYTTSETSPGFNLKTGKFSKSGKLGNSSSDVTVNVDSSLTYQTFRGIGVGITDSAAYDFNCLSTKAQGNLIESVFGEKGIEVAFGRIPAGPTDFSLSYYSYDDTVNDVDMTNFALTDFEIATKIPMIQQAYNGSSRGLSLLATPWTPPGWMKDNNDTAPGFLMPEYKEAYANYIIKFLDAYKEYDLDFWGLSEGNEIIMGYNTNFEMPNVLMFPNEVREWTKEYLGPMLEEAGYENLTVLTMDDERSYLAWYSDRILSDSDAAAYIDGFAVHWYDDSDDNTDVLDDFHTNFPDKFLILTEAAGGGDGPKLSRLGDSDITLGDWSELLVFVDDIFQNFNHWVEGYITWNLCLNLEGGPYQQMSLGAPILIDTSNDKFYKQPTFYAFGHFSKFIYPGSVRINMTVDDDSLSAMPFGGPGPNPTGGSFTGGPGPNPTTSPASYSFSGVASTNPDGSTTVILLNPSSDAVSLTLVDSVKGTISTKVAANSLNTFIYW